MVNIPEETLYHYKGSDHNIVVSILGVTGKEPLSGDTVVFEVLEIGNDTPILTKSTADVAEIEITGPSEVTIKLLSIDFSTKDPDRYFHRIWHTDTTGFKHPALTGYFWLFLTGPSVVREVRDMLDEAGEVGIRQMNDEIVPPTTLDTIFVSRGRIKAVQGVWVVSDSTHASTNFYTGGGFHPMGRQVDLGSLLPDLVSDVRVSYTWESGISNEAILHHLLSSKNWAIGYSGTEFNYLSSTTQIQKNVENLAIARVLVMCVLTINGANVAQMGYNFRLGDFEVQTKLWGEGMIAQELFKLYTKRFEEAKEVTGRNVYFKGSKKIYKKYSLYDLLQTHQTGSISESQI